MYENNITVSVAWTLIWLLRCDFPYTSNVINIEKAILCSIVFLISTVSPSPNLRFYFATGETHNYSLELNGMENAFYWSVQRRCELLTDTCMRATPLLESDSKFWHGGEKAMRTQRIGGRLWNCRLSRKNKRPAVGAHRWAGGKRQLEGSPI